MIHYHKNKTSYAKIGRARRNHDKIGPVALI